MTEQNEDFEELRRIAEASQKRAGIEPGQRGSRPLLGAQDFLDALPAATDAEAAADELHRRQAEAAAIRGMLPEYLRAPRIAALPDRVPECDFLRAVSGWCWGSGNLLLLGPTGTGKSTACAWLFRNLLARAVQEGGAAWENARFMAWFHAGDLADARREHALGKGEAPELGQASRARLLVLDDAGWDRDPLACSAVLKDRYELRLPTIVTSGKTEDELIAHYGAAVVRRMTETGGNRPGGGIMARFPQGSAA